MMGSCVCYDHQYVIGFGLKESVVFTFFIIFDPKQISRDHNIQSHYYLKKVEIELLNSMLKTL